MAGSEFFYVAEGSQAMQIACQSLFVSGSLFQKEKNKMQLNMSE
jgi:hypothetical protein